MFITVHFAEFENLEYLNPTAYSQPIFLFSATSGREERFTNE